MSIFAIKIGESAGLAHGETGRNKGRHRDFIINEILIIPALPCFVMGHGGVHREMTVSVAPALRILRGEASSIVGRGRSPVPSDALAEKME